MMIPHVDGHEPPASPAASARAAEDARVAIRRALAHWHVIVAIMAAGALVTLFVVRSRRPLFKSETVIVFSEGIGRTVTGPTDAPSDAVRSLGTKLKEMLLAQQTQRALIEELGLYPEIVDRYGYAEAVDQMRRRTEFKSRSVDTFAISFEGVDRAQAQKVCARMADILVAENAKRLRDENKGTTEFLLAEKKRADDELDRVEREMSEFLQAHPEFATARDGLGTEVLALKNRAEEEEKRRSHARPVTRAPHRGAPTAPPSIDDRAPAVDPVLLTARSQAMADVVNAKRDLADKSLHFTEQHPDVRAAAERLAAAEAALRRADDAIAAASPKETAPPRSGVATEDPYGDPAGDPAAPPAGAPLATEQPVPRSPKADPDAGEKVVSLEIEWARQTRAHALAKTRQADLEAKLYRAQMLRNTAESGFGTRIAVLDPAFKPSAPCNLPNRTVVLIGFVASLIVGLALSAVWGLLLDDRLFAACEVEATVAVPLLGVVPKEPRGQRRAGRS